jgi:peptide/nickel transport system ATP-binding protein
MNQRNGCLHGESRGILDLKGIRVRFTNQSGTISAVDTVDFSMEAGESCALIGESGCGKSVLGMTIMGIHPSNATVEGTVRYNGTTLTDLDSHGMLRFRGGEIAMIPQNSAMVLNPVMTIGRQTTEAVVSHCRISRKAAESTITNLFERLMVEDPGLALNKYPHEFSGGMRERILIAMALACSPSLIIADEPTAGLDLLVRNQTIELLKEQTREKTLLLITHDLGSAYLLCSRMMVMYAGEIVEEGPTKEVLSQPRHPYTLGLIASIPSAGLNPIPGMSPPPDKVPGGCRFSPRCRAAGQRCREEHPSLQATNRTRKIRCWHYDRA